MPGSYSKSSAFPKLTEELSGKIGRVSRSGLADTQRQTVVSQRSGQPLVIALSHVDAMSCTSDLLLLLR